eukprot:1336422-Amorphochlora_amoeboformis.AAC.1
MKRGREEERKRGREDERKRDRKREKERYIERQRRIENDKRMREIDVSTTIWPQLPQLKNRFLVLTFESGVAYPHRFTPSVTADLITKIYKNYNVFNQSSHRMDQYSPRWPRIAVSLRRT